LLIAQVSVSEKRIIEGKDSCKGSETKFI
jgi:hypothetical protein